MDGWVCIEKSYFRSEVSLYVNNSTCMHSNAIVLSTSDRAKADKGVVLTHFNFFNTKLSQILPLSQIYSPTLNLVI